MTADELAALVARTRAGDHNARHALLVELYGAVRKHIYLLLGSGAMADDAVQDTMIALYRGLPAFRGEASARTWALSIATRTAWRVRKREARYRPVADDGIAWFDLSPTEAAELAMLRRALSKIAAKKRDAFVLMAIFELTAEEAGRALGTFANTAASRFRHARAELAEIVGREKFDEPVPLAATKKVGHG